jgi:protein TonB
MPVDLFDPASRPTPAGSSRRLTVLTSIALHAAAIVVFLLAPLAGAISLPSIVTRIDDFVMAAAMPHPPALPQPPAPSRHDAPAANPAAAPIHAPRSIEPEVDVPAPGATHTPGGIVVSGGPGVPGGLVSDTGLILPPPPAPQTPRAPVPVGGNIRPPSRVTYVPPVYPAIAQSARIEGTVILEAVIDESGAVTALKVLRSVPLLDEAARTAVARWRYSPTTLNGVKVPVIMTVTVTFTLK